MFKCVNGPQVSCNPASAWAQGRPTSFCSILSHAETVDDLSLFRRRTQSSRRLPAILLCTEPAEHKFRRSRNPTRKRAPAASGSSSTLVITKSYTLGGSSLLLGRAYTNNHGTLHARGQHHMPGDCDEPKRRVGLNPNDMHHTYKVVCNFTMEGKQGRFPTGVQLLEAYVHDGQQAIPNLGTNFIVSGSVLKLPFA